MDIREVVSESLVSSCRKYLISDCVTNVLPLGDLYSPLFEFSDVTCAIKNNRVTGVCSIFHAYPIPSIVLGNAELEIKRVLVEKAVDTVASNFITMSSLDDTGLFCECGVILESRSEQQMIIDEPTTISGDGFAVDRIGREELDSLNQFYIRHHAEAWIPTQFQTGPYYCVKQRGKIVSVAGVHIVTPKIAQLGNIMTDEHWRRRGFGTACVSALTNDLVSKGRIVSLFVLKENNPAIRVYEKLGFRKARDIAFLRMQKK